MFNFFDEIKQSILQGEKAFLNYNLINISGKILYVEGHCGLTQLSKELITFKVKDGRIVVEGDSLVLSELTDDTIKITGKIKKIEVFWWKNLILS